MLNVESLLNNPNQRSNNGRTQAAFKRGTKENPPQNSYVRLRKKFRRSNER